MDIIELGKYKQVQDIARQTIDHLKSFIVGGVSEADIYYAAQDFMLNNGASSFWYHDLPAIVLVGGRTKLSVSGKEYEPTDTRVKRNDLVTVDLGPQIDSCWGDFARTLVVGDGKVIETANINSSKKVKEFFEGITFEIKLHDMLQEIATPDMTFGDLYSRMNKEIETGGYKNLDFKGNLGHSIEKHIDKRIYIVRSCNTKLSDVLAFTFEPHIQKEGRPFGYKREDIYYFCDNELRRL